MIVQCLIGFVAGALAILAFHQVALKVLTDLGRMKATTFSMAPTKPFGVPTIVSQAFWGGLWGVAAILIVPRLPGAFGGPLGWVLFVAIVPTVVNWFVVMPLKGSPVGGGFKMPSVVLVPLVYAWWGFGMWLIASLIGRLATAV
jgi:hypothetical protein